MENNFVTGKICITFAFKLKNTKLHEKSIIKIESFEHRRMLPVVDVRFRALSKRTG